MSNRIQTLIKRLKKFGYHVFKPKIIDVVCNMKVEDELIFSEYKGKAYSFCSEHCQTQFDANPAQFEIDAKNSNSQTPEHKGSCCH